MMKKGEYYWVRIGDADTYHKFDGLNDLGFYLAEHSIDPEKLTRCRAGIADPQPDFC